MRVSCSVLYFGRGQKKLFFSNLEFESLLSRSLTICLSNTLTFSLFLSLIVSLCHSEIPFPDQQVNKCLFLPQRRKSEKLKQVLSEGMRVRQNLRKLVDGSIGYVLSCLCQATVGAYFIRSKVVTNHSHSLMDT